MSEQEIIDYGEDVFLAPKTEQLNELAKRAQELKEVQSRIQSGQQSLKELNKIEASISGEVIPSLMTDIGMQKFTLNDGSTIEIEHIFAASLSGKTKEFALQWCRENNQDSIIKRVIVLSFGKGEDEIADAVKQAILEKGGELNAEISITDKEDVNTSTFKSIVRELDEQGHDLPLEKFGVWKGKKTKIS